MTKTSFEKGDRRALRRHHLDRAKARAFSVARLMFDCRLWHLPEAELNEIRRRDAVHRYRNRARCSCSMCGNPRRNGLHKERLTLAERRAAISFREEMIERFNGA